MNAEIPSCPFFLTALSFSLPSLFVQLLISVVGSILISNALKSKMKDDTTIAGIVLSCAYGGFIGLMFQSFGNLITMSCGPGQASVLIWIGKIFENMIGAAVIGIVGSFASIFVFFMVTKSSEDKFDYHLNAIMSIVGILGAFLVTYLSA